MKKILLGTSALAMAGAFAGQANAATWDLDWGGYYETSVVYRTGDGLEALGDDAEGVDVVQDGEINFTPSITLDNGLTFGVDVQLEADSQASADIIDESYVFVSGSFGRIQLGSENAASYAMAYGAPDVTWIGVNSGSLSGILGLSGGGRSFPDVTNDANQITYFTPRFSGFQVGVSYAHDSSQDKNSPVGNLTDIFSAGANYVNSFGAFDIAMSATYSTGNSTGTAGVAGTPAVAGVQITPLSGIVTQFGTTPGPRQIVLRDPVAAVAGTAATGEADPTEYALGMTVGYAGFSVGGSYGNADNDRGSERDFFDVGVSYTTGPWATSFTYSNTDNNDVSEVDQFIAGVNYKLGPGVLAGAYAGYMDVDVDNGEDLDGFVIGTGFKLSF